MASITMCMIVKNESSILKRCLDSYAGTYDELIIVDTGSTDNTKEIASEYTNKIYDFEWINDFAAARNFAFSKASREYIFSADADEELDEKNRLALIDLKKALLPEIDIVQMKYVNMGDVNMVYNFKKELRPKLFKRLRKFEWISPIHETVRLTPVIFDSDIEIMHKPQNSHSKRDFSTFTKAIERGVHLENYVVIMFCKELFISGDTEDFINAKPLFENVLALEVRTEEVRQNIAAVLARIYRIEEDTNSFFKIALNEIATAPNAEICMELGVYYYNQSDYETAITWFLNASGGTQSIIDVHSSGDAPLRYLSMSYEALSKEAYDQHNVDLGDNYKAMADDYAYQADIWQMPEE